MSTAFRSASVDAVWWTCSTLTYLPHRRGGPGVLIAYERGEPPRGIAIVAADTGDECVIPRLGDDRNPSWAGDAFRSPE